jgi:hypothetical protein
VTSTLRRTDEVASIFAPVRKGTATTAMAMREEISDDTCCDSRYVAAARPLTADIRSCSAKRREQP